MLSDFVDGADIGVVERCRRASLAPESLDGSSVGGHVGGKKLQCDVSVELGVFGLVDDTHPAGSQHSNDLIMSDFLS